VKSFGWENNTAHPSPIHSWNRILPSVVSASKSGAVSLIAKDIIASVLTAKKETVHYRAHGRRHMNG
jgi:hypothetical protein